MTLGRGLSFRRKLAGNLHLESLHLVHPNDPIKQVQTMKFHIRSGKKEDLPQVLELIQELADYERASDQVENTVARMEEDGFGENPVFDFIVAEADEKIIGISIYYFRYSTWKGKSLYLEDLIVTEKWRGAGAGKALLDETARIALEKDCAQLSWQVLDWNEPAINFYKKLGASLDGEWINCRLTGEVLRGYLG